MFVYFSYDAQWFGLGSVADAVDGRLNNGATATEILAILAGGVVASVLAERRRLRRLASPSS